MSNDRQGRDNPASRAADLDRMRRLFPAILLIIILWSLL